ncbi:MAG: PDZ domain-containing protein [Fibrobacteraceae bacterium]|nr:PDZ domain-containing protein [Fibrobacteraceae bacterium]
MSKKNILAIALFSMLFWNCTSSTDSNDDSPFPSDEKGSTEGIPSYIKNSSNTSLDDFFNSLSGENPSIEELYLNHTFLRFLYLHQNDELDQISSYIGQGAQYATISSNHPDYPFIDTYYMYATLSDEFTSYFGPYVSEEILSYITESEEVVGIGAEVETVGDQICVSTVYWNSPAEKAGLKRGDCITAMSINGSDNLIDVSTEYLFNALIDVASKGTAITIKYTRDQQEGSLTVVASSFAMPTVILRYKNSIPVLQIIRFTDTTVVNGGTYEEFMHAMEEIKDAKSMVIDLRGNPGGSEDHCVNVASAFVSLGDTMGYALASHFDEDLRMGDTQRFDTTYWIATSEGIAKDKYVVLLADEESASCAEVMTMILTNLKQYPMVGKTTYGKGIGQYYLSTLVGLAGITAQQLYDNKNKSYHGYGIAPDINIDDEEQALETAVEMAALGTVKRTAGYGTTPTGNFALAKKAMTPVKRKIPGGFYKILQ